MTVKTESPAPFVSAFEKYNDNAAKQFPAWFNKFRQNSYNHLSEIEFPTVKDEEWKYTNLTALAKISFDVISDNKLKETKELDQYLSKDEINLIFINGSFSKELSNLKNLPQGLTILPLSEAFEKNQTEIEQLLSRYEAKSENYFISLNQVLAEDGLFIRLDKNASVEKVIHILYVNHPGNKNAVLSHRNIIIGGKLSEATVLETHVSFSTTDTYLSNSLTDIYLEDGAILHHTRAQKESANAFHVSNIRVWIERNARFDGLSTMTGGIITRNDLNIVLNGEGGEAILNGLYLLNDKQHADNHTLVEHRAPNCQSNQYYKGILNGSSHGVFNGKIHVFPIAQQTNSYQLNKNLLLGKHCVIDTKPQLEIFADDVKCTHGATIGQLNEEEIFYLQSRCISREAAVKMLARGFVDDLLNTVKSESVNTKLHALLEETLQKI